MKLISPNITPGATWHVAKAGGNHNSITSAGARIHSSDRSDEIAHVYSGPRAGTNAKAIAALPKCLKALETLLVIANEGVVMRHETCKPQWSILDEIKTQITPALIAAGYTIED